MTRAFPITLLLASACSVAPQPASPEKSESSPPFRIARQGSFDEPFAMAFLPDGRMLITEKAGKLKLRATDGAVTDIGGVPAIEAGGQGGLLDVAPAPDFATSRMIYLSYAEPRPRGSSLALARATLGPNALDDVRVIWRQGSDGNGGQYGAVIAFSPDRRFLFLSAGERQRKTPAQDPNQYLGKIMRLSIGNLPEPGGQKAEIWSTGHRNPYGLAFAEDGRLWETEMGPMGGDELNLILPDKNYGWPLASNGSNYVGTDIPDHRPGDRFEPPKLFWDPSISPGGFMIYSGTMFPLWKGSGFIAALSGEALIRVTLSGDAAAKADRWNLGERIRDVAQAPDGAIWLLEDGGDLVRLTPR